MWSIEVLVNASEEEIEEALLEEVDFDYVRKCVAILKGIVEKYGPFKEIQEKNENSKTGEFVKTYHEKRGWICDELASIDPLKVWTLSDDPVNGYSYLMNGYFFNEAQGGRHAIRTWYIADKSFEKMDDKLFTINTEFRIWHEITDAEESEDTFYIIDIWELVGSDDLSDEAIAGALSDLYYF